MVLLRQAYENLNPSPRLQDFDAPSRAMLRLILAALGNLGAARGAYSSLDVTPFPQSLTSQNVSSPFGASFA